MLRTTRNLIVVFCLAGLVLGGGCGATEEPGQAAGAAPRASAGSAPSACALITAQEAEAILGNPVVPKDETSGTEHSSCAYESAQGEHFWLTVYWTDGKEQWHINETARGIAGRLMQPQGKKEVDQVMKTEAADQLGDRSSFSSILGSYVLKGDVLLEFRLNVLRDERQKWEALARKALSRL
jgi:hypothetical protein